MEFISCFNKPYELHIQLCVPVYESVLQLNVMFFLYETIESSWILYRFTLPDSELKRRVLLHVQKAQRFLCCLN